MVPNNFKLIKQDYIISNTSTNKKNLIPSNTANNVMRLKIGADCYLIKDANHNLSLSKLVSSSFTTANVSLNNNCCPTNDESKGTKIDNQCSRTKNHRSNTIPRATLAKMQRYSMGDYLRSLILEDLHSPDFIGKSEQQIAADRCIKIMKFFDNPEKKFRRKQFNNRCRDECNIRRYRSQSDANLKAMSYLINSRCFCCKLPMTVDNGSNGSEVKENNDLATNYFRRVYEFLKQQPKDGRSSSAMGKWSYFHKNHQTDDEDGYEKSDDTSSSSCDAGKISQRRIINGFQGEEALCLHRTTDQEEEEEDDADSANFFRPQLRDIFDNKHRPRPPLPVKCRVNTRDISKYFDYPNKENRPGWCTSPPAKEMGSNLSRHHGKGLTGRRTQSSGNLCEPKGKINHVGKMLVPCSSTSSEERYKFSGSLPNYLDNDSNSLIDDLSDNNNTLADTICGNLGGTLPHKKPHYEQNHVKYHSHDSLEGDPWRYQQSNELDVVRCKHGTLDIVRRSNRDSHEHAFSSNTMVRHSNRSHPDLDIVAGTLPTRRIDPKWCDPAGIGPIHQRNPVDTVDGSFAKVVHKPDCELMKHRQVERCQAARKSKRIAGEHQDQGYASERSPEDEHPPVIAPDSGLNLDRTFRVTLQKSSRGLGLSVSGGGASGPIRIKRLFPQQPAALSNKLQPGDILLAANGVPLTSLTNYEALEVLRTSANTVELLVCRQPGENSITPPGAPPTPPARREAPRVLNPVTPLNIEPCGEFDIEMTKVEGSLGFTLRKVDSSALGHYVRALVREPALSDGRIQPGDKIVAVDGAPLSPMSHEEAVALLRQCGPKVKLRLYRDLAQTPVSALSPTEPDHPLHLSRTSLRQEAMDMLCDLAVRKLSPSASDGLGNQNTANATSSSPRKLRKPRTPSKERSNDLNHVSTVVQTDPTDSDDYSNLLNSTSSGTAADSDASRAARPKFLDLSSSSDRTDIQFGLDTSSECRDRFISSMIHPVDAEYALYKRDVIAGVIQDNNLPTEPVSMPPVSCDATFSYKNPAYQSANPTCSGSDHIKGKAAAYSSDQNIPGRLSGSDDPAGNKGLLKWKGVMFAPDDSNCSEKDAMQNNNLREINPVKEDCEIFMVELTRGWNSRLGFSLQAHENGTIISMVHPDSVAAKDGRLKQGDILLMVNDESVTDVPTNEIIDLLRKIRGSIGITVARKKKQSVT